MSVCSIEGCTGKFKARGFCARHYWAQRRKLEPEVARRRREACKAWYWRNRETELERAARKNAKGKGNLWAKANRGKCNANKAKRRAQEHLATPMWADLAAIKRFYENCPPGHEVDHYYPLQSEFGCGLHVLENLQYLPKSENRSKGNNWPSST